MYNYKPGIVNIVICKLREIDHGWLNCTSHATDIWEYILKKYTLLMIYYKLKFISHDINNPKRVAKSKEMQETRLIYFFSPNVN